MAEYFYGTGRRKKAVARVRLYPGTGQVTINGRSIDDYFGLETLKTIVRQPLQVTNTDGKYDIVANVKGGGFHLMKPMNHLENLSRKLDSSQEIQE